MAKNLPPAVIGRHLADALWDVMSDEYNNRIEDLCNENKYSEENLPSTSDMKQLDAAFINQLLKYIKSEVPSEMIESYISM